MSAPANSQKSKRRNKKGTSKHVPAHYKAAVKDSDGNKERTDDRPTPRALFESFNAEFNFSIDVCGSAHNHKVKAYFDEARDGLSQNWARWGACWCNPPYGDEIPKWLTKAITESARGATVVVLVPASISTIWFRDLVLGKAAVRWVQSKIKFIGQTQCAPFHSMALVYGPGIKPTMSHMRKFKAVNRYGQSRFENRPVKVWKHYSIDKQLLFDPVTARGSWFNVGEQEMIDSMVQGMYFGCRQNAGHFFWPGPPHPSWQSILREHQMKLPALKPIMICFDGVYTPEDVGYCECSLTYIEQIDTTVLAWTDQTIDTRPGSNSAIIAIGRQPLAELVKFANQHWPDVLTRQGSPLKVVIEQEYKTLREALSANAKSYSLKMALKKADNPICEALSKLEAQLLVTP